MRVNLGCGRYPLEGWTNVDLVEGADLQADIVTVRLDGVTEIAAIHVLEHLPYRQIPDALANWRSWCVPGAAITVEVPDMEAISLKQPDPRWELWTYGSQEHDGEFHRAGFDARSLERSLSAAGWSTVQVAPFASEHEARRGMPCLAGTATT